MKKTCIALAGSLAFIALSCSKTSEKALNNSSGQVTPCDTANRTYSANVVPILSAHCYSCHGSATSGASGIILEGYDQLRARADDGELIGVITHADGFPAMPKGGPKLSDCDINTIRSWINNGKQNN